jgi:hypothetical protein
MIKTFLSTLALALIPTVAMAQAIPQIGVSTGSQVINIQGQGSSQMETWGNYQALEFSVLAGGSIDVVDFTLPQAGGSLGAVAGFSVLNQEGGYYGQSQTSQTFTGQSQSSFVNF